MTTTKATQAVSQRLYEIIAARKGVTITQLVLLAGHPRGAVRSSVGWMRTRGLVKPGGYVQTGKRAGCVAALWIAAEPDEEFSTGPMIREREWHEGADAAARWAELMAGRRYEDAEKSRPVVAPRRYSAEPMSGIGCAAAMCAGAG